MTAKTAGVNTGLRDVQKCNGDIANQNGTHALRTRQKYGKTLKAHRVRAQTGTG